jgi:hypothetical protein
MTTNARRQDLQRGPDIITIHSDVHPDGQYGVSFRHNKTVRWLTQEETMLHAHAVLQVAHRSEHDAAVFTQLTTKLNITPIEAAQFLRDLDKARPPLDVAALHPLYLTPRMNRDGQPLVMVKVSGVRQGFWTMTDCIRHAVACIELAETVVLDQAYYDYLAGAKAGDPFGDRVARAAVMDLVNYMDKETPWRQRRT